MVIIPSFLVLMVNVRMVFSQCINRNVDQLRQSLTSLNRMTFNAEYEDIFIIKGVSMFRKICISSLAVIMAGVSYLNCLSAENSNCFFSEHDLENYFEIPEHQTLIYRAKKISKRNKRDKTKTTEKYVTKLNIDNLVKDGISTCYNAYKLNYDQAILQEHQRLISLGAFRSSYAEMMPIIHAKSFSEAIINQVNSLAQQLSPNEKQAFWNIAGSEIKRILGDFCTSHGCKTTGDLCPFGEYA